MLAGSELSWQKHCEKYSLGCMAIACDRVDALWHSDSHTDGKALQELEEQQEEVGRRETGDARREAAEGDGGICWQPIRPLPSNRALTFVPVHFMHNQRFDLMEKMNFTPRSAVLEPFV